MSLEIINPESLGVPKGFSHGMLGPRGGRVLFVAGQTSPEGDFTTQFTRALERVVAVVRAAGGTPEDIGRLTIYVTDRQAYIAGREAMGRAYRAIMGKHYPGMAMLEVKGLLDSKALVELEATAVIP